MQIKRRMFAKDTDVPHLEVKIKLKTMPFAINNSHHWHQLVKEN
jgi:hypothetical protein